MPPETTQPPDLIQPVLTGLRERFGEAVREVSGHRGEVTIELDTAHLVEVATWLRDDPSAAFTHLSDLSGTDYPERPDRLCVDYHLYSREHNVRLRLKVRVTVSDPHVPTVTGVWPTANWHEREIYDMMGIKFNGHPDLRRILMWDGYPFFPLRKDFPLQGLPSEMPDVAFTKVTPLEGGPFVTVPSTATAKDREPRARPPEL